MMCVRSDGGLGLRESGSGFLAYGSDRDLYRELPRLHVRLGYRVRSEDRDLAGRGGPARLPSMADPTTVAGRSDGSPIAALFHRHEHRTRPGYLRRQSRRALETALERRDVGVRE